MFTVATEERGGEIGTHGELQRERVLEIEAETTKDKTQNEMRSNSGDGQWSVEVGWRR